MSDTALIRLEGVKKVFVTDEIETHALSSIHAEVHEGEYVSFSGPSGCGKSTLLSHLGGASVGREGTALQMGGALADQFSRWIALDTSERRTLLPCGVSAGFAAVFGTPFAAAVFALEFVRVRSWAILPCLACGFLADLAGRIADDDLPAGIEDLGRQLADRARPLRVLLRLARHAVQQRQARGRRQQRGEGGRGDGHAVVCAGAPTRSSGPRRPEGDSGGISMFGPSPGRRQPRDLACQGVLGADHEPVKLLGEEDAVDWGFAVAGGQELALDEVPDHNLAVVGA